MRKRLAFLSVFVLALGLVVAGPAGDAKKKPDKKPEAAAKKGKDKEKTADASSGQGIYKNNCAVCHFADKTDKRIGPGLKGLFKKDKMFDDRPVNEENVRDLILNGGGKMIPFKEKLDSKQVDDLMAYLKTL